MSRLCTICARGGSKGVKNKNLRDLMGKPLISYSIEKAIESGLFEFIAVSSDSSEILETAKRWGAEILINRPLELAADHAAKIPAIRHCVLQAEQIAGRAFDVIVDLDATSPLRSLLDIQEAVQLLEQENRPNVITGTPSHRSPYFNMIEIDENGRINLCKTKSSITRRQDSPPCYDLNASIYVWRRDILLQQDSLFMPDTGLYVMPKERSFDIDCPIDFEIVEALMKRNEKI